MLIIQYKKYGIKIGDFEVEEFYQKVLVEYIPHVRQGSSYTLVISSSSIVQRIRLGIMEGEISPDEVLFYADQMPCKIDENGDIENGYLFTPKQELETYAKIMRLRLKGGQDE